MTNRTHAGRGQRGVTSWEGSTAMLETWQCQGTCWPLSQSLSITSHPWLDAGKDSFSWLTWGSLWWGDQGRPWVTRSWRERLAVETPTPFPHWQGLDWTHPETSALEVRALWRLLVFGTHPLVSVLAFYSLFPACTVSVGCIAKMLT